MQNRSPDVNEPPTKISFSLLCIIALAAVLAYVPVVGSYFQEDDFALLAAVSKGDPFGAWSRHGAPFFRPIVSISFWIQYRFFGLNPIPFRIFNDLLHGGCAVFIGLLATEFFPNISRRRELFVTTSVLFLLAPSHTEAVNWICSRTDLIATFFGLASFYSFVKFVKSNRAAFLWISFALFVVASLSKESVLLLPLCMAVYLALSEAKSKRYVFPLLAGEILLYILIRVVCLGFSTATPLTRYKGVQLVVLTIIQLARETMPGAPLGDPSLNNLLALKTLGGVAILLAGLAMWIFGLVKVRQMAQRRELWTLAALFCSAWLPAAGLSVHLLNSQGERFLYLSSAITYICLGIGIVSLSHKKSRLLLICGSAFSLAFLTWQNLNWAKSATLSKLAADSFSKDVAPNVNGHVLLACVPGSFQGSGYGLIFQYQALVDLFAIPPTHVFIGSVAEALSLQHRITSKTDGAAIKCSSADPAGYFGPTGFPPNDYGWPVSNLESSGRYGKRLDQVELTKIEAGIPVYYWNGHRFLSANHTSG